MSLATLVVFYKFEKSTLVVFSRLCIDIELKLHHLNEPKKNWFLSVCKKCSSHWLHGTWREKQYYVQQNFKCVIKVKQNPSRWQQHKQPYSLFGYLTLLISTPTTNNPQCSLNPTAVQIFGLLSTSLDEQNNKKKRTSNRCNNLQAFPFHD